MTSSINAKILRTLAADQLPSELKTLQSRLPDDAITEQLLSAVERGSISTSVFAAWLGVCKSPVVIQRSLRQNITVHIRHLGIKQLKNGLDSTQWENLWDGLGGTAGLLEIFSDLSVVEVKAACRAIGRCASDGDVISKRARVTELFKGLHPDIFPDTAVKTNDLRPLTKFYQALVPSCDAELVNWITSGEQEGKWLHVREEELLEHQSDSVGQSALRSVFEQPSPDARSKDRLKRLSTRFPSTTTSETGFSASMKFALRLLHYVVETSPGQAEDEWVVENLIRPLLRRAVRKRASWARTKEIVTLAMEFLERCRNAENSLTKAKGDVLHMVALCWSRRSALFETHLKHLLRTVYGNSTSFEEVATLLAGVPRSRRYALLRLSCQEVMGVDLDSEQGLSKARGRLPSGMLNSLEAPHALGLFKRLRSARGDVGLVDLGLYSSVLVTTRTPDEYEGDPDIYYLVLLNRNGLYEEAESYATNVLEVRGKTTRTIPNRDQRAEHALSVWACANASGSLRLLSETVQWAKGFIRDQLTASKLFSTYYDETCRLLSGFLVHSQAALELKDLHRRVKVANKIMTDLLDIACAAIREPFFRSSDWCETIYLFTRVVRERVQLSAELKQLMAASDEEMYNALWEDTIAMLIRVEKQVNQEDYERLGASAIGGVIGWQFVFSENTLKTCGRDTWMFVDNLAKIRNDLWTEMRSARYPDVFTLPDPFPRGLPVQHYLSLPVSHLTNSQDPWTPNLSNIHELTPYIFSRVKATLFPDPQTALKPVAADKPMQQAIGAFVDNYTYALRIYVADVCDVQEKKKRLEEVWSHAIGPLSAHRMNHDEASRHWKRFVPGYLQQTLHEIMPKKESIHWPLLPKWDNPFETQEWNPLEGRPEDVNIKARNLGQATYIDFSTLGMHSGLAKPDIRSHFKPPTPQLLAETRSAGSIWSFHPYAVGPESTEAAALAALLYLDTKYGTTERLLTTPFPSVDDVRYPCLYLDEEFLSSDGLRVSDAAMYACKTCTPLPLMHKVATRLLTRLTSTQNSNTLENATLQLIRALSESDRPGLAFALAIKVIVGQPSASSWHRMLFSNGFLQRIAASDAKKCISSYVEAISERLDAQKLDAKSRTEAEQNKKSDSGEILSVEKNGTPQRDQPFVKITTLKSVAQILNGSTYIGDDASLEILLNLSQKVSHIDVRVSILKTLLTKLEVNRPKLWDRVLSTLEAFIPLIGSLNERESMPQVKYDSSSLGGSDCGGQTITDGASKPLSRLPMIRLTTRSTWREELPMLDAILSYFLRLESSQLLELYMKRIVSPVVDALEEQTAIWTMLFLRKYASDDIAILDITLPPTPKGSEVLDIILSKPGVKSHRVPQTLLDRYVAYLTFRINPPASIRRLNSTFERNPSLRSIPEVRAWLELYGTKFRSSWSILLPFNRISNFNIEDSENNSAYITARTYQEAFLRVFRNLLSADGPVFIRLQAFVSSLYEGGALKHPCWNDYGRTTVEAMIAYVNSIRKRDWERDPNRIPAVLPDVFAWRLLLLSYPLDSLPNFDPNEARERNCKTFAKQLAAIIDEISESVYHVKLQTIKDQVRNRQNTMLSAIYLGDISKTRLSWLTTSDLLRVDLAAYMMLGWKGIDIKPLDERLKALLGTWITSDNEEVRRTGYNVRRQLFDTSDERLWDEQTW